MAETLHLFEQHIIDARDPRWQAIDAACLLSKNLYNAALYAVRQHFFATGKSIRYSTLAHAILNNADYRALPRKVSQRVLRQACGDWNTFWKSCRAYKTTPQEFTGRPRLPGYKHKTDGRNLLTYTEQATGCKIQPSGLLLTPSQLGIQIKSTTQTYQQLRILPRKTHYLVEVIYTCQAKVASTENVHVAAIDIGLNNLATVASDQPGFVPLLVNGRPLKSINQCYNKARARLQAALPTGSYTSHALNSLTGKRNRRVKAYLHPTSSQMVQTLVEAHIGTLVIGKNDGWKQAIDLSARNNQAFVQVPHAQFINMLTYKAQLQGIQIIVHEESYTSKCSFLDNELPHKYDHYAGKQVQRGLFRTSTGRFVNADVNGAYNILRKVFPKVCPHGYGIAAAVVEPVRTTRIRAN